jgi:hypothetical protein
MSSDMSGVMLNSMLSGMLNSMSNTMSRVMPKTLASSMSNTMLNWIFCCQMTCLGHTFRHDLGMLCDMTLGMFFGFTGNAEIKIRFKGKFKF